MILYYDSRDLEDVIPRIAEEYKRKIGRWPNICYVNRATSDGSVTVRVGENKIRVRPKGFVLKNHYQLGESDAPDETE